MGNCKGAQWRLGRTDCDAGHLEVREGVFCQLEGVDMGVFGGPAEDLMMKRTCTLLWTSSKAMLTNYVSSHRRTTSSALPGPGLQLSVKYNLTKPIRK